MTEIQYWTMQLKSVIASEMYALEQEGFTYLMEEDVEFLQSLVNELKEEFGIVAE